MKCTYCDYENPAGLRFCGHCGTQLGHLESEICPGCGFANPGDFLYCGMCASPLGERYPPAPEPIEMAGERRVATVILADVTSSTDLLEKIGSEAWVQIMNQVFVTLEGEINCFGGKVDQFRGDGLVAFFGADTAHEDDPERAVLAGLGMQRSITSFADDLRASQGLEIQLRVGINTGELIVTHVGDRRQHPTEAAMGEAVAVAARMETAAKPGTVLVSENTYRLAESHFEWLPLGEINVKGLSKPIAVFRPLFHLPDRDLYTREWAQRSISASEVLVPNQISSQSSPGRIRSAVRPSTQISSQSSPGRIRSAVRPSTQISSQSSPGRIRSAVRPSTSTQIGLILSPIGRQAEFGTLKNAIDDVQKGRGGIVLVSGEKGAGKSFLVRSVRQSFERAGLFESQVQFTEQEEAGRPPLPGAELSRQTPPTEEVGGSKVIWLGSSCHSYEQAWPLSIWKDTLQKWVGRYPDEAPHDTSMRLKDKVSALWEEKIEYFYPFLATFLSLPLEETYQERVKHLNAQTFHDQFFIVLRAWLEILAVHHPIVVAFHDLQWADRMTIDLLKYCLPLCEDKPLLWLFTFRPERSSLSWDFRHFLETEYHHRLTVLDLGPLQEADSRELIHHMIGSEALSERTKDLLVVKSQGNAYYLGELLKMLIAQGVIQNNPDTEGWFETRSVSTLDLPDSLQNLLRASIDRLQSEERRVLQIAAVIGSTFWRNILAAVLGEQADLSACLITLLREQFILERNPVPGLGMEYVFTPLLIADVAYESLLSNQRISYHRQVAQFLESSSDLDRIDETSLSDYSSMLAYHYRQAGDDNKEYYYTLNAAVEARKIFANPEALHLYTRTLELLDLLEEQSTHLDAHRQDARLQAIQAQRFEVLNERGRVYMSLGRVHDGNLDKKALLTLAEQMAGVTSAEDAPFWMVDALLEQPQVRYPENHDQLLAGQQMAYRALELSHKIHDQTREMKSMAQVAWLNFYLRQPSWQADTDHALELARHLGDRRTEARLLLQMGDVYGLDNLDLAMKYLEAAQPIIQQLDDPYAEIDLLRAMGEQFERKGDYYRQLTDFEEKRLEISQKIGNRLTEGNAWMYCGQIRGIYLGDLVTGLEQIKKTIQIWDGLAGRLFPLLRAAQIQILLGVLDEAEATLAEASELSQQNILDISRAGCKLVRASINNAHGDEVHLKETIELGREIEQLATEDLVSRQYQMASACEISAAHLGLAALVSDETVHQQHIEWALESSLKSLGLYEHFGFVQIVECTSEEILFRHSLALRANNRMAEADEFLSKAHTEMMRKHALIPFDSAYRITYLENLPLHRQIVESYQTSFGRKKRPRNKKNSLRRSDQ